MVTSAVAKNSNNNNNIKLSGECGLSEAKCNASDKNNNSHTAELNTCVCMLVYVRLCVLRSVDNKKSQTSTTSGCIFFAFRFIYCFCFCIFVFVFLVFQRFFCWLATLHSPVCCCRCCYCYRAPLLIAAVHIIATSSAVVLVVVVYITLVQSQR